MYQVYIDREEAYEAELAGEYQELEDAQKEAKKVKKEDPSITYIIKEANGSFNSYGELLTTEVERG